MLECAGKGGALLWIVPQEVQQLGEAPLVRVDAAAPLNGLELLGVGERRDLLRLFLRAMVAPEVVLRERLHGGVDRHDA